MAKDKYFPTVSDRLAVHIAQLEEFITGMKGIAYDHPDLGDAIMGTVSEVIDHAVDEIKVKVSEYDAEVAAAEAKKAAEGAHE